MIRSAFTWLTQALASTVAWFDIVLDSVDAIGIFLAVMFVMLSVRYILAPLVGQYSGSVSEQKAFAGYKQNVMSAQQKRNAQYAQRQQRRK